MKDTIIIVPTYEEADNISNLIRDIFKHAAAVSVVVVDDNSKDGTVEIVKKLKNEFSLLSIIERSGPRGLGASYRDGFTFALKNGYKKIITMDADFSHPPDKIPLIISEADNHDIVIGSRYIHGGGTKNWALHRKILSCSANFLTRLVIGVPVRDITAGFKCYSNQILSKCNYEKIKAEGYSFIEELFYRCVQSGKIRVREIPIIFVERREGKSKISKREIFNAIHTLFYLLILRLLKPRTG